MSPALGILGRLTLYCRMLHHFTVHCTIVHCRVYNVQFTLYYTQCTRYSSAQAGRCPGPSAKNRRNILETPQNTAEATHTALQYIALQYIALQWTAPNCSVVTCSALHCTVHTRQDIKRKTYKYKQLQYDDVNFPRNLDYISVNKTLVLKCVDVSSFKA